MMRLLALATVWCAIPAAAQKALKSYHPLFLQKVAAAWRPGERSESP